MVIDQSKVADLIEVFKLDDCLMSKIPPNVRASLFTGHLCLLIRSVNLSLRLTRVVSCEYIQRIDQFFTAKLIFSMFQFAIKGASSGTEQWIQYLGNDEDLSQELTPEELLRFKRVIDIPQKTETGSATTWQDVRTAILEQMGSQDVESELLDWRLSLGMDRHWISQDLTLDNLQWQQVPEDQKTGFESFSEGLKWFNKAVEEGVSSRHFDQALSLFRQAESVIPENAFNLNRLGHIYLYSQSNLNLELAEQYFVQSAKATLKDLKQPRGGTLFKCLNIKRSNAWWVWHVPSTLLAIESYLYAGRICFIRQKGNEAMAHVKQAEALMQTLLEKLSNRLTQDATEEEQQRVQFVDLELRLLLAKLLAADGNGGKAAELMKASFPEHPGYMTRALLDQDLASSNAVLSVMGSVIDEACQRTDELFDHYRKKIVTGLSVSTTTLFRQVQQHLSGRNFRGAIEARKLLVSKQNHDYRQFKGEDLLYRNRILLIKAVQEMTLDEYFEQELKGVKKFEDLLEDNKSRFAWRTNGTAIVVAIILFFVLGVFFYLHSLISSFMNHDNFLYRSYGFIFSTDGVLSWIGFLLYQLVVALLSGIGLSFLLGFLFSPFRNKLMLFDVESKEHIGEATSYAIRIADVPAYLDGLRESSE